MAKKRKQLAIPYNATEEELLDPEDDQGKREDERGRTVLAFVGNVIQSGSKIPLEWHAVHKTPRGDHKKTFTRYIGVVVRERVCISYVTWKSVPKELKDQLYGAITVSTLFP